MLNTKIVNNICNKETKNAMERISSHLECQYAWERKEAVDYEMFRFSNPLYYNAKYQIDIAKRESEMMFIKILKELFLKSGFKVEDIEKRWDEYSKNGFTISSASHKKESFYFLEDIQYNDWEKYKKQIGFKTLNVIYFSTKINFKFDEKPESLEKIYKASNLHVLFERFFDDFVYEIVTNRIKEFVNTIKEQIGVVAVSTTSNIQLYYLKQDIRGVTINTDYYKQTFWKFKEKKQNGRIIGYEECTLKLEEYGINKETIAVLHKQFIENEYFRIMLGDSDFAKSLMASEWLFRSFNSKSIADSKDYDFTPIICGYLKSMEQLLFLIIRCFVNKGCYTQASFKGDRDDFRQNMDGMGIKNRKRGKNYLDIELTDKSIQYIDTTLGASINFLKTYSQITSKTKVFKNNDIKVTALLECFRVECRNGYFHTDNIYEWNMVKKIRKNAFYIYFVILGNVNIGLNEDVLGVLFSDAYEDLCNRVSQYIPFRNTVMMSKDGIEQEIRIDVDREMPIYEKGRRIYKKIPVIHLEKRNSIVYETDTEYLTEKEMPDDIYILDSETGIKEYIWKKLNI